MELLDVLSDKPIPARTEVETTESATDVKPEPVKETAPDPAASSAAKETDKAEAKPETVEQKPDARDRDDKGRFVKHVPQEALHAERVKRQELEAKLKALEQQKPVTSVLENEDQAFSERLSKATAPIQEKFFRLSVKLAKNAPGREDFDDVVGSFLQAAQADPRLDEAFRNSDDPGEYAYIVGKQIRELADVGGDILKYGEKKRAEGSAQAEALQTQIKALQAEIETLKKSQERREKIPQSLNGEQSATARGDGNFAGPTPLKNLLS